METQIPPGEVTRLLKEIREGNTDSINELFELVNDTVHELAHRLMHREDEGHTLQTTALLNEAVILLLLDSTLTDVSDRVHLYSVLTKVMRQVLVDHHRKKNADKRGGDQRRVPVELALTVPVIDPSMSLVDLHDSLEELGRDLPRAATVIDLRFFASYTMAEIANLLGVSLSTVEDDWRFARAWLRQRMAR